MIYHANCYKKFETSDLKIEELPCPHCGIGQPRLLTADVFLRMTH